MGQILEMPSAILRRQSLIVNVMRACRKCGAPGVYHGVNGINPGCYDPDRIDEPVGDTCPQCKASRVAVEPHGEVWFREWRASLWPMVKEWLISKLKRRRRK